MTPVCAFQMGERCLLMPHSYGACLHALRIPQTRVMKSCWSSSRLLCPKFYQLPCCPPPPSRMGFARSRRSPQPRRDEQSDQEQRATTQDIEQKNAARREGLQGRAWWCVTTRSRRPGFLLGVRRSVVRSLGTGSWRLREQNAWATAAFGPSKIRASSGR